MMTKIAIDLKTLPMMVSSYFYFTKARFFAGLFVVAEKPILSGT